MDKATVDIYERGASDWLARRPLNDAERQRAARFGASVPSGTVRVDLGCGPGRHTDLLGAPLVGLDAAHAMVALHRARHPEVPVVRADLTALPFRQGSVGGGWANCCYQHLASTDLPMALAELHWATAVGGRVAVTVHSGEGEGHRAAGDFPGRYFSHWSPERLTDLFSGAGFADVTLEEVGFALEVTATRARSLPDTVGAGMRLLVCGLNPSVYAADTGVAYARLTNRFWPAAVAAGLVDRPRDPIAAVRHHGIGMTDLVRRATVRSAEVTREEYAAGADRVRRLVQWLQPGAVCFVGLEGYRTALDRAAVAGWQVEEFGGRPAYVMPSTSGLNATSTLDDLVTHLRTAAAG